MNRSTDQFHRHGFTLVEILIVVVILGILAAIAVPKFLNASLLAREGSLKEDLRLMRTQVGVYRASHGDVPPGYPGGDINHTATQQDFIDQLTQYTNAGGTTSPTRTGPFIYGPYLNQIPVNPLNSLATLKILGPGEPLAADGTTGWLYQPSTNTVEPNASGTDADGQIYTNY